MTAYNLMLVNKEQIETVANEILKEQRDLR